MRKMMLGAVGLAALIGLQGCVTQPLSPTVPVMPGKGKSFSQFQEDDVYCQHYASDRVAGKVARANDQTATNALVGAAIGAALGAAVGDTRGAVVGGAAGAGIGATTAHPGERQYAAQREYNIAYVQCMQAHGNHVAAPPPNAYGYPPPPPPGYQPPPPPPPGYPPPPPPGYPPPPPPGY
ncbi:MAG: hypothetical protein KGO02_09365 [Alphaproteobacteria bacterium]|nr:hypothetical protein [Alphaproteobacteria bacterium]